MGKKYLRERALQIFEVPKVTEAARSPVSEIGWGGIPCFRVAAGDNDLGAVCDEPVCGCRAWRDCNLSVFQEFGIVQIGLNPLVTDVDVGRLKQSRTKIRKFVRDISRTEQNLPCRRLNFLLANGE